MAYHRYHGVDTKIVRIFNTYGPRMRAQRRPRRAGVHVAGAAQRGRHRLRRRLADAQLHLHHRSGRRHHQADALDGERSGQHRQPARDDDQADRRDDHQDDRLEEHRSSTSRCRPTTRSSAGPTSPAPARCSAGSRRCSSKKGWSRRSSISGPRSVGARRTDRFGSPHGALPDRRRRPAVHLAGHRELGRAARATRSTRSSISKAGSTPASRHQPTIASTSTSRSTTTTSSCRT